MESVRSRTVIRLRIVLPLLSARKLPKKRKLLILFFLCGAHRRLAPAVFNGKWSSVPNLHGPEQAAKRYRKICRAKSRSDRTTNDRQVETAKGRVLQHA